MEHTIPSRSVTVAAVTGAGAGALIAAWNLFGMYTTIAVGTWDVGRQVVFLAAVGAIGVVAARTARAGGSWLRTGWLATVAAVGCATTVLVVYAASTKLATNYIRQVPEFILDYTNNGYTSPATYFQDHYWALLELQVFTWIIGAAGLAAAATVVGRARLMINRWY